MNAKQLISMLAQLNESDRITLSRKLLPPTPPNPQNKIQLEKALGLAAQLPLPYRHAVIQMLLEGDRHSGGNGLCVADLINHCHSLLLLCQDHGPVSYTHGIPATIPHDFILEGNLDQLLRGKPPTS